jgi:hypothetical protein
MLFLGHCSVLGLLDFINRLFDTLLKLLVLGAEHLPQFRNHGPGLLAKDCQCPSGIQFHPAVLVAEQFGDGGQILSIVGIETRQLACSPAADRLVLARKGLIARSVRGRMTWQPR